MPARASTILFFSRGRGRGHALPDLAIADELARLAGDLPVRFVSYGTGARTLAEHGRRVVDLQLPDDAPYLEILVRATRAIAIHQPQIVVSHEEFAALPAAKAFDLPTSFIVDFFPPVEIWHQSLSYADEILFAERRGVFAAPPRLASKVRYVGPLLRRLTLTRADRADARSALGLPPGATVVAVIPGAWATEDRAPIADLVVPAFQTLAAPDRALVWVGGRDHEALARRLADVPGGRVLKDLSPIERLMVASDLVITKANRGTTIDLASLGIPSISLSFGLNPIDEAVVPRIPSNVALQAGGLDGAFLAGVMADVLARARAGDFAPSQHYRPGGAGIIAHELLKFAGAAEAA